MPHCLSITATSTSCLLRCVPAIFLPSVLRLLNSCSVQAHQVKVSISFALGRGLLNAGSQSALLPLSVLVLTLQLEVIFAALWSVASWRGVYAGLRPYI